jgi:hypothetical protein
MIKLTDLVNESYYDSNKLYSKEYIDNLTKNAPRNIKDIVKKLEVMTCINNNTKQQLLCVQIPEVLFVYISGRY